MAWIMPILEAILLPPGIFLIVVLASLILMYLRLRRAALVVGAVGCGLLYLFSITPVADLLVTPLENAYPPYGGPDGAGYVVVLGGGLVPVSPAQGGRPSPSPESLKRIVYGARLASESGLPLILSGGIVPSAPASESEATVAERTIHSLGITESRILLEGRSRNTWENAVLVERRYHPCKVILVTSAFHMRRSVLAFERNGIAVVPAPTDYLSDRAGYNFYSFLPNAGPLKLSAVALKEYLGYAYYRLFLFHHQA